jgi:hypothetical protein
VRETLDALDETTNGLGGARLVRVEPGVVGLTRFWIVGVSEERDPTLDDAW